MHKCNAEPCTLLRGGGACLPHTSEVSESSLSLSEGAQDLTGTSCNSSLLLLKDLCKW